MQVASGSKGTDLPKINKYRNVETEVPFGGELGKVRESAKIPNFSKQGEAVGKTKGRKAQKPKDTEKTVEPEPKKKSRRGGDKPAAESKPKRQRVGKKDQVPKETI